MSEADAIKELYAAINRGDIASAMKIFAPDIARTEPEGFPSSGTYHGLEAVKTHLEKGRGTWAEGSCEPERLIASGDKIVVYLYVRVRLKNSLEWIEGRIADGFLFRAGKAVAMRTFADRAQALEWAGIKDVESLDQHRKE